MMMTVLQLKYWTIGILFFSFISIDLLITGTFGAETTGKGVAVARGKGTVATADATNPDGSKVKCKEEIEEALKKYGDKGKSINTGEKIPSSLSLEDDDDDDDEEEDDPTQEAGKQKGKGGNPPAGSRTLLDSKKDTKSLPNAKKSAAADDDDDDTGEDVTNEDDDDDDDEDDDEDDGVTGEDDEDDEEEEDVTPEAPKSKTTAAPVTPKKPEPVKAQAAPAKAPVTTTPSTVKKIEPPPAVVKKEESAKKTVKQEPIRKPEQPQQTKKTSEGTAKQKPEAPLKKTTESAKKTTEKKRKIIESDEDDDESGEEGFKSRSQVEDILKLYEIGTKAYLDEQAQLTSTFKDLKKIYESAIKPLEQMYKYKFISSRLITDAEIFSKPMVLFCGPKSSGKTSLVNYLLGVESTPWQLRTGVTAAPSHFTIVEYGDNFSKLSPMEISADFAFSNLQQFGQHFVENHLEAFRMPLSILQRITIVDSPGLVDGFLSKAPEPGKSIDAEVYQWFVDRADIIYIVVESTQVHLTQAMKDLLEQLKGRDVRFIISKAEMISQTQAVMLIGQLLWSLSPVMPSDTPPQVYALTTLPVSEYNPFLDVQEEEWLTDLSKLISAISRVESRAAAIRRHAVRVRNHAKVIDCYLSAYYKRKPLLSFGNAAKKLAQDITENPHNYNIFKGALAGITQNVSRYDLPDPDVYREFFRVHPLLEFKTLSSTCSFFSGCPIDKLDKSIAYRLPDLVTKFKKVLTAKDKKDKKSSSSSPSATTTTAAPSKAGKK